MVCIDSTVPVQIYCSITSFAVHVGMGNRHALRGYVQRTHRLRENDSDILYKPSLVRFYATEQSATRYQATSIYGMIK